LRPQEEKFILLAENESESAKISSGNMPEKQTTTGCKSE